MFTCIALIVMISRRKKGTSNIQPGLSLRSATNPVFSDQESIFMESQTDGSLYDSISAHMLEKENN